MNASPACIAGGHPATVSAAADVLAAGGNAFDACVAAGFAAAVAEPCLTSLGGGGFLLAHTARGDDILFDFFVDTPGRGLSAPHEPEMTCITVHFPGSDQDFHVGPGSIAVPGCLAGYLHVHRRLGRVDLDTVVAPAIRLAGEGLPVNDWQAYVFTLLEPILRSEPDTAALYLPGDRLLAAGDLFVNPDLAGYLSALDPRGFAEPSLAERLAGVVAAGGGLLTVDDLRSYEVVEREPLGVDYRGAHVLTNPPPSFGGELVALGLRLLEERGPAAPWGAPEHAEALVESMLEVDAARAAGDVAARLRTSRGTTHVSVADTEGNVATMTTSNGEGAGLLAPGTGILLNNMLGEDDLHPGGFHAAPPGERVSSMMSPTIVLDADRRPVLAVGSGGSKRIRTAILQVVASAIDEPGAELRELVERPRLHWDGEIVQAEPGFPAGALDGVAGRWPLNEWRETSLYFGGVHAVRPGADAAGDPRRGGVALVAEMGSTSSSNG